MEKRAMTIIFRAFAAVIGLTLATSAINAQTVLNGSFEIGTGSNYVDAADGTIITTGAVNWVQFANGLRISTNETGVGTNNVSRTGEFAMKCYGSTDWGGEGAYQIISNGVQAGHTYILSGWGYIPSGDPLTNSSPVPTDPKPFGLLQIGWRDTNNVATGSSSGHNFYSTNGLDTWISGVVTATAPVNAAMISVYVMELGFGAGSSGSIFWDDISIADLNAPITTNFYLMTIAQGKQVCWPTQTNAAYQAQSSPNNVTWANVGDPIPGDGGTNCTFDAVVGDRFFRVLELK